MWFLMRRILAYGRFLAWTAAMAAAGGAYVFLSTRQEITLFGAAPHVLEWWEPYVWPAVVFIVVGRILRGVLRRTLGAANTHVGRISRGQMFGPKGD